MSNFYHLKLWGYFRPSKGRAFLVVSYAFMFRMECATVLSAHTRRMQSTLIAFVVCSRYENGWLT